MKTFKTRLEDLVSTYQVTLGMVMVEATVGGKTADTQMFADLREKFISEIQQLVLEMIEVEEKKIRPSREYQYGGAGDGFYEGTWRLKEKIRDKILEEVKE